jgi:hypothetical protein
MPVTSVPGCVYHPAIDRLLTRLLGDPGTAADIAELRRTAEAPGCEPVTVLLHEAALRAGDRDRQLTRKINHMRSDLQAAARELADARPAEHLLTGRHDELLTLAARHNDALTCLEQIARAYAAARTTNR